MTIYSEGDFERIGRAILFGRRARAYGAQRTPHTYTIAADCAHIFLLWLRDFAKRENLRVEVVGANGTRVAVFAAGGVLIGAGAGALLAGLPGAALGAGAGLLAGYGLAHVRVTWDGPCGPMLVSA